MDTKPLTPELLEEAIERIKQYSMKRWNEFLYVEQYVYAQQEYIALVEESIKANRVPMTWQAFVAAKETA